MCGVVGAPLGGALGGVVIGKGADGAIQHHAVCQEDLPSIAGVALDLPEGGPDARPAAPHKGGASDCIRGARREPAHPRGTVAILPPPVRRPPGVPT